MLGRGGGGASHGCVLPVLHGTLIKGGGTSSVEREAARNECILREFVYITLHVARCGEGWVTVYNFVQA